MGLAGCSQSDMKDVVPTEIDVPDAKVPRLVPVELTVSQLTTAALAELRERALNAWGDSYEGMITGCLSGYARLVSNASSSIKVMEGDRGCTFRLTRLVYETEIFEFSQVATWQAGASFSVTGSLGSVLSVRVAETLAETVEGPQHVTIQFGIAEEGTSQQAEANIGTGISISGEGPIKLDIVNSQARVDGTDGGGIFTFTLECAEQVKVQGDEIWCDETALSTLEFGMAEDIYNGDPTAAQCRELAASGGRTGTALPPGMPPRGGLLAANVKGPAPLFSHPRLIFAIAKRGFYGGCKYFSVQVQE